MKEILYSKYSYNFQNISYKPQFEIVYATIAACQNRG